jgi:cell division protein FtsZ
MTLNLKMPDITELKPKITVFGVGGAGGNAVNNMIESGLTGVEFVVANTDSQALTSSSAERIVQMGVAITEGLGAGSQPEVGRAAAEEVIDEIGDHLSGAHMVFITAGMGGGTGTGAAPVIARAAREMGILAVGVVTKPFDFEGKRRMRVAEAGIEELQHHVDTLIVIPNQNLFRIANEKTTFSEAFAMADQVLYSGVACITDLMVKEGLINLDFADVRAVMRAMGKAMMGTGEASGDRRAVQAAEAAIANPLLDETSMRGAKGLLISITGGNDLTLFEVDEAASRIREEVDPEANIILGATFDESLDGVIRVSVVATGIDNGATVTERTAEAAITQLSERLRNRGDGERPAQPQAPQPQQPAAQAEPQQPVPRPAPAPQPAAIADNVQISKLEAPRVAAAPEPQPPVAAQPQPPGPAAEEPFVPPVPDQPDRQAPRMPRVEDFPPIAQEEIRARRQQQPARSPRDRQGLIQRLANDMFGRREEAQPAPAAPPQSPHEMAPPQRPVAGHPQPLEQPEPVSEFARRPPPAPGAEAATRRHQPQVAGTQRRQANSGDDDQYEIPAFLRRQAN